MAPPSPRRSSRARATTSQSHHSSASSSASGRAERNARSLNKTPSGKTTPSASLSSEPLDDPEDTLLGRRRKRGQDDEQDKLPRPDISDMANGSDDVLDEEDEAVRCPCGSEDYPGRPLVDSPDAEFFDAIEFTEDVTGFFVQCDICKVWQHGACVGIFSAESSPDEYFCEQCRKDLHKIHIAKNGQKYSKYVPLYREQSRSTSRAASISKETPRSPKAGTKNLRPNSATQSGKRRSTMNSRDAAYDDEQLRRAIEASKEETARDSTEAIGRRTKRGRSDSEDNIPIVKRLRTDSQSESPAPELEQPLPTQEEPTVEASEDDGSGRNGSKKPFRAARNPKERSEKDEKERQRQEAANKRKGRAERRRAEDSEPSDDVPMASLKVQPKKEEEPPAVEETPPAPQPTPGTPPTSHPTVGSSHKRGARSNHKKGKGKNQYTKDKDAERDESPARSMSRDIQKNTDEPSTSQHNKGHASESKASKHKTGVPHKMSMLDMRRRVAAIMDFISRTQVDLAAEGSIGSSSNSTSGAHTPQQPQTNGHSDDHGAELDHNGLIPSEQGFKDLNCVEMMDVLTRDMVKWQNQYT